MQRIKYEIFKEKRKALGLSIRQVEERTGVNRTTVSNFERGTNVADGLNLLRLMRLYRIEVDEIMLAK